MNTNLSYGGIPYNGSFVIDKVYPNYKTMMEKGDGDGIFVGRHVLISYTNKPLNVEEKIVIEMKRQGKTAVGFYANLNPQDDRYRDYYNNYTTDIAFNNDSVSYDNTVWQRVVTEGGVGWQLIANLNSHTSTSVWGLKPNENILEVETYTTPELDGTTYKYNVLGTSFSIAQKTRAWLNDATNRAAGVDAPSASSIGDENSKAERFVVLLNKEGKAFSYFDATDFLKDSYLQNVEYQDSHLIFTFITEEGVKQVADIALDLVDTGDGLSIEYINATVPDSEGNSQTRNIPTISAKIATTNLKEAQVTEEVTTKYTNYLTLDKDKALATSKGLDDMFDALADPELVETEPSFSFEPGFKIEGSSSASPLGSYEVGTWGIGHFNFKFADGIYKHLWKTEAIQRKMGCTRQSAIVNFNNKERTFGTSVTDWAGNIGIDNPQEINKEQSITITKDTSLKMTAKLTYNNATNTPIDNLGRPQADEIWTGRTIENESKKTLTGYREGCFYGAISTDLDLNNINSALIRGLSGKMKKNYEAGETATFDVSVGTKAIIIACPATDEDGVTSFTSSIKVHNTTVNAAMPMTKLNNTISVEGKNGYTPIPYNVWIYQPAEAYTKTASLKITLQ